MKPRPPSGLLDFDWEALKKQLESCDPNDGNFYMIVINKSKPEEFRTRFMSFKETAEFLGLAVEKKRLRVPIVL